jgi:hypothetical protein
MVGESAIGTRDIVVCASDGGSHDAAVGYRCLVYHEEWGGPRACTRLS